RRTGTPVPGRAPRLVLPPRAGGRAAVAPHSGEDAGSWCTDRTVSPGVASPPVTRSGSSALVDLLNVVDRILHGTPLGDVLLDDLCESRDDLGLGARHACSFLFLLWPCPSRTRGSGHDTAAGGPGGHGWGRLYAPLSEGTETMAVSRSSGVVMPCRSTSRIM